MQARLDGSLENTSVDSTSEAIAACGGDARVAVTALIATLEAYEMEVADLRRSLTLMKTCVSYGFVRGRGMCVPEVDCASR